MINDSGQTYLRQNLRYLLVLRLFALAAQILALFMMHTLFDLNLPLLPITLLITVFLLYTAWYWYASMHSAHIQQSDFILQLIIDIVALSLLIYFTGGATNPFIFFFLLPITFAAATLAIRQTAMIALLAMVSYTLLMFFHVPVLEHAEHNQGFDLHIWGMWYGFLVSAALVSYFVWRVGLSLRQRNKALSLAREENLRAGQVLALGTLAAGTAHELGTPLATMAILTKEMEHEFSDDPQTFADLKTLRQQIDRCKNILSRMVVDAGDAQADSGAALGIEEFFHSVLDEWMALRPETVLTQHIQQHDQKIQIVADRTLRQSIINVLNNAADAAEQRVDFTAEWNTEEINLRIVDDGKGIDPEAAEQLGQIQKQQQASGGLGIGLFLAQLTLNRLGGQLTLDSQPEMGTQVLIHLPLATIKAT